MRGSPGGEPGLYFRTMGKSTRQAAALRAGALPVLRPVTATGGLYEAARAKIIKLLTAIIISISAKGNIMNRNIYFQHPQNRFVAMLCCLLVLSLGHTLLRAQSSQGGDTEQANFLTIKKNFEKRWAEIQEQRRLLAEEQKKEALMNGRTYTETGGKAGYKTFKRWEWYWATRVNADGSFPSPEQYEREWRKYQEQRSRSTLMRDMAGTTSGKQESPLNIWTSWQHLGPFGTPSTTGSGGVGGTGLGRITCIAFGGSEDTIFVGTPASGIWRTQDRGQSWYPQSTELPPHGVFSIAVDPRNNGRVFMGTSNIAVEAVTDGGVARGSLGIYRSTDKGATWTNVSAGIGTNLGNINRIRIHPTGPDTVFAATSQGIWRSNNGGTTWFNVAGGNIPDLEFHPTNPSIIYATSYRNGAAMPARIWRSTTGGTIGSFNTIMTNVPTTFGRIELAVSADEPNWIYAMGSDNTIVSFSAMYRTTNTGDTWSAIVPQGSLSTLLGTQAFVNFVLAAAPGDANTVCAGGLDFWRSDNGGTTNSWEQKTEWDNAGGSNYLHSDQWDVAFPPGSSGSVMYIANDGGIYRSTNWGTTWTNINGNMSNMTLYRLGIDQNHAHMTVVGSQDNGSSRYWPYVNGTWHPTWTKVRGGDGMESLVSPSTNNDNVYTMIQNGKLYKSTNWGASYSENTPSGQLDANGGKGYWVTPMIYFPGYACVMTGYDRIYAYKDNDPNIPEIGHRTASVTFPNANELATVIAVSANGATIYAATINTTNNTFQVYRGNVSTVSYTPLMSAVSFSFPYVSAWTLLGGAPATLPIASIAPHPTDPEVVYVSCGRNGGVYKSLNRGRTWTDITGSLPQVPVNSIVVEEDEDQPYREGLYIGTDFGVYYRDNAMADWDVFDIGGGWGLSNSPVMELEIHRNNSKLRAATFGRGLYETTLYTPSQFTKYYPVAFGRNSDSYWIQQIKVWSAEGTEENTSGDNGGYIDVTRSTTVNIEVFTGGTHLMQLTRGIAAGASTSPVMRWRVWIDMNKDGTFDDAGELVGSSDGTAGTATTSLWLNIPESEWYVGTTRMRVAMGIGATPTHNGAFTTGEVEDYTVTVSDCINFGGVLSAYPVESTTATVIWAGNESSTYELRYRVKNSQTWTVSNAAYQPYPQYPSIFHCVLNGLTANTNYEIQVRAKCGATVWGGVSTVWLPSTPFVIRTIPSSAPYCASFSMPQQGGVSDNETYITNVTITRGLSILLNHTSANDFGYQKYGYSGWALPMAQLPVGVNLGVSLTAGELTPPDFNDLHRRWRIWIDRNGDYEFGDHEMVYDSQNSTTSQSQFGTMSIPLSGTTLGITRMRVSMKGVHTSIDDSAAAGPCELLPYGEVQDYKVQLYNPNARAITGVDEMEPEAGVTLQLAPNPASDELQVTYTCFSREDAIIEIVDIFGRVMHRMTRPCMQGSNSFSVPLHTMAAGVYTLRINNMDHVVTQSFTIVR